MRTAIKLCGFHHLADAVVCSRLDIDAVGMILVPNRKRTVSPTIAKEVIASLPKRMVTVGVMMNLTLFEVEEWLDRVPLDRLQFHGQESPRFCQEIKERLGIHIIKVFSIADHRIPDIHLMMDYLGTVDGVLFDTVGGGTGNVFPWERLHSLLAPWRKAGIPIGVAGGLHSGNVRRLLTTYLPDGVDVSSGIETQGRKDPLKMRQFVERVREFDRQRHTS